MAKISKNPAIQEDKHFQFKTLVNKFRSGWHFWVQCLEEIVRQPERKMSYDPHQMLLRQTFMLIGTETRASFNQNIQLNESNVIKIVSLISKPQYLQFEAITWITSTFGEISFSQHFFTHQCYGHCMLYILDTVLASRA